MSRNKKMNEVARELGMLATYIKTFEKVENLHTLGEIIGGILGPFVDVEEPGFDFRDFMKGLASGTRKSMSPETEAKLTHLMFNDIEKWENGRESI